MLNQESGFLKCFRVFLPTKIGLTSKDEGSSDKPPLFGRTKNGEFIQSQVGAGGW